MKKKPVTRNISRRPHGFIAVADSRELISPRFSRRQLASAVTSDQQDLSTNVDFHSIGFGNLMVNNNPNSENGDFKNPMSEQATYKGEASRGITSPSSILRPRTTGISTVVEALACENPNIDIPVSFNRTVMSLG